MVTITLIYLSPKFGTHALALRYCRPLLDCQVCVVDVAVKFSIEYALDFRNGGDEIPQLPIKIVREPNDREYFPAQITVHGVLAASSYYKVCVVPKNTKKQKYLQLSHASFTPFVVAADGAMGNEAKAI